MANAVFTILDSFVGKQESYLTATERLKQRLEAIYLENLENLTETDSQNSARATIHDITPTHEFLFKSSYKPFVACAHDYFKIEADFAAEKKLTSKPVVLNFFLKDLNGDFINDQVLHIKFDEIGSVTPALTNNVPNNPYPSIRYKYCDFPGIRLIKSVSLYANELLIDKYTTEDLLFYFKSRLDDNKIPAWEVMLGQEQPKKGTYYNRDFFINQIMWFTDGAQTAKPKQPALDLWIPLIFDYNLHVDRSLHNSLLRTQQLRISVELNPINLLLQGLSATDTLQQIQSHTIKTASLYTKNIYLPPEINDLFVMRDNFALIRVFRRHEKILSSGSENILLNNLKYPIETLTFGFRPNINNTNTPCAFNKWYKFADVAQTCFPVPALVNNLAAAPVQQLVARTARFYTESPVINTLSIQLHGNVLYKYIPESFFNNYTMAATPDLTTSGDVGIYYISFAHYPLRFNPSGFINSDVSREFYLAYTSSYISFNTQTTLYISAQTINMLLYDDNSIKLKYI